MGEILVKLYVTHMGAQCYYITRGITSIYSDLTSAAVLVAVVCNCAPLARSLLVLRGDGFESDDGGGCTNKLWKRFNWLSSFLGKISEILDNKERIIRGVVLPKKIREEYEHCIGYTADKKNVPINHSLYIFGT